MRLKWFPWKFLFKYVALKKGFIDPIQLLSRFSKFAQPSEVFAPIELMRAGAVMHARGLINSQVIQHNLDWVWPYWVERQFDPLDASFIPRAFSLTHINLTHRNWTAAGIPGLDTLVLVDPRGLVTPFFDSWSIDTWLVTEKDRKIIPSRTKSSHQKLTSHNSFCIETDTFYDGLELCQQVSVITDRGLPVCLIEISGTSTEPAMLIVALRPYNPEGISFIHKVESLPSDDGWIIDNKYNVFFDRIPSSYRFSNYHNGDVFHWILSKNPTQLKKISCDIGMVTAMAIFPFSSGISDTVKIRLPLYSASETTISPNLFLGETVDIWSNAREQCCTCVFPYKRYQELFDTAVTTLLLHSPDTIFAGPYTYKRFWFRDAAFIINALLCIGITKRSLRIIQSFFKRQNLKGYFLSQDGEWDSNGQALWTMMRYCTLSGNDVDHAWEHPIEKGAEWIISKRIKNKNSPYFGLFPAGFSAEHLGPNDYYYWDDFWGVAGLRAASFLLGKLNKHNKAQQYKKAELEFIDAITSNLNMIAGKSRRPIMPASPNRRPDSGAVGSLVAGYPLQLWDENDHRLQLTAGYLYDNCCINNSFYHDISHSGINPYLTLHLAQIFLRNGDIRHAYLTDAISDLASPTGQWPEAIHPQLSTGCMGDGQHVWAAAEWVMIIRNSFVREEPDHNSVILCSGVTRDHIMSCKSLSFGPTQTAFGSFTVHIDMALDHIVISHEATFRRCMTPDVMISLCGLQPIHVKPDQSTTKIMLKEFEI
jgi:hypothetical protein